jgi:hypothetical protein
LKGACQGARAVSERIHGATLAIALDVLVNIDRAEEHPPTDAHVGEFAALPQPEQSRARDPSEGSLRRLFGEEVCPAVVVP